MNAPMDVENRVKQAYKNGDKSLFLQALELSGNEMDEIRNWEETVCCPYARFAVFLHDFWSNSDGAQFWDYWRPHGLRRDIGNKARQFDNDWTDIFEPKRRLQNAAGTDNEDSTRGDDNARLDKIKSKCWVLNSSKSSNGRTSNLWSCLRDAVHSYQGNDGEIDVSCHDGQERRFMTLLKRNPESIEWKEYCELVGFLARHQVPPEEPWKSLVENCGEVLGAYAYVDWYLRLENNAARFIVGFDEFPAGEIHAWKTYMIDEEERRILGQHVWREDIAWDESTRVAYGGSSWETLAKENDNTVFADNCLFESAEQSYGVFARYREGCDERSHWWKKELEPELSSRQSEFIVCARDDEALRRLRLLPTPQDALRWECKYEGRLDISNPDGTSSARFPYRIYEITNRPYDRDVTIAVCDGEMPVVHLRVNGRKASPCVENAAGIRLTETANGIVTFWNDPMRLLVKDARTELKYKWTVSIDSRPIYQQYGPEVSVAMDGTEQPDEIRNLQIKCEEISDIRRRPLPSLEGVVLPHSMRDALLGTAQLPESWRRDEPGTNPITDHLEGFRKEKITDRLGCSIVVGVPDDSVCWWFEKGHLTYSDDENTVLHNVACGEVRSFNGDELNDWSLCMPPVGQKPDDWDVTQDGYWRCRLSKVIGRQAFRYGPNLPETDFLWTGGELLFRYRYAPSTTEFCSDMKGHLGLFVPAEDQSRYRIVAFSDRTSDLLLSGKCLATTNPGLSPSFRDIHEEWGTFCRDNEGRDAILLFFPEDGAIGSLFDKDLDSLRVGDFHKGTDSPYDEVVLPVVRLAKDIAITLPEVHPVKQLKMHFMRTVQVEPAAVIRESWRKRVQDVFDAHCDIDVVAVLSSMFSSWKASGFDVFNDVSVRDDMATVLESSARERYRKHPPNRPPGWRWKDERAWIDFFYSYFDTSYLLPRLVPDIDQSLANLGTTFCNWALKGHSDNQKLTRGMKQSLWKCFWDCLHPNVWERILEQLS